MKRAPPVLFLIFNRPDLTEISFEQIRKAKPAQLFVAADGPRADRDGEDQLCKQARRIIERVDWPCELKTLFRAQNLGCRRAVSEAISWFFEHVEEGIILEDDCVPNESFFHFCEELLTYYRQDSRVMSIAGSNLQNGVLRSDGSYYFSKIFHCWGWATWRRAWRLNDFEMSCWPRFRDAGLLSAVHPVYATGYWHEALENVFTGRLNTWDFVFAFSCWMNSGLSAVSNVNLVKNIGFGPNATHTQLPSSADANIEAKTIPFPLIHPDFIVADSSAEDYIYKKFMGLPASATFKKRLLQNVKSAFRSGFIMR